MHYNTFRWIVQDAQVVAGAIRAATAAHPAVMQSGETLVV
jgi:hypothetical protein